MTVQTVKCALLVAAIATLSACQAAKEIKLTPSSTEMAPAPFIVPYKVGDHFMHQGVKSGNKWEKEIIKITNKGYTYRTVGGKCETTLDMKIPFYAPIRGEKCSYGQITRDITDVRGSLWPLKVGNKTSFTVSILYNTSTTLTGHCEVKGAGQAALPYGMDNVYYVVCKDGLHQISSFYSPKMNSIVWWRFERHLEGVLYADQYTIANMRK